MNKIIVENTKEPLKNTDKFKDIDNTINPIESEKSCIPLKNTFNTHRSPELLIFNHKKSNLHSVNLNNSNKSVDENK